MRKLAICLLALTFLALAQEPVTLPDWVAVEPNIHYDQYKETVLDILQPKTLAQAKRPGVLVIHGGGWVGGSKERMVQRYCLPFLEKGFVVANVEYRLAKVAPAPAAVADVLKAGRWFRENAKKYNVDRKRIVVIGSSAGGHLALMVGMATKSAKAGSPVKVAAVINIYGITDVRDQLEGPNMRKYAVTWVPEQPGRMDMAHRLSPLTYVRRDLPPILTIHGDADETVPYEQGYKLTKALRDSGVDAQMISVPQGKHGFTDDQWAKLWPQIFTFLERRDILR
jgi:acetyl esterase/lipase